MFAFRPGLACLPRLTCIPISCSNTQLQLHCINAPANLPVPQVCKHPDTIQSNANIKKLIGSSCHGVIGQLTEDWGAELYEALKSAGGTAYSNYAVGYNNVKVPEATSRGIAVGNTPGAWDRTLVHGLARRFIFSGCCMYA